MSWRLLCGFCPYTLCCPIPRSLLWPRVDVEKQPNLSGDINCDEVSVLHNCGGRICGCSRAPKLHKANTKSNHVYLIDVLCIIAVGVHWHAVNLEGLVLKVALGWHFETTGLGISYQTNDTSSKRRLRSIQACFRAFTPQNHSHLTPCTVCTDSLF